MIKHLDKMIGAQVWSYSKGSKADFVFNFAFFATKFITSMPIAVLLFDLIDYLLDFPILNSRLGSFIAIMRVYPLVDHFTIKRPELKKFISQTSEE